MLRRILTVFCSILAITACSSLPTGNQHLASAEQSLLTPVEPRAQARESVVPTLIANYRPPSDLWERMRREFSWLEQMEHPAINRARRDILAQPRYLPVAAERAQLYLHYIVEEVERRGLPMELALVPLVESMLNPFASSPSRAVGLWQIMPRTGKSLSLEQDWWYDGRRDIRNSTRAALDYLESHYRRFDGDWMLALAAYNAGKSRVIRAQRRNENVGKRTDYWSLSLPAETRAYVPKVIALSQIISEPERYGTVLQPVPNRAAFEVAVTGGQVELYRAAKLAGMETSTLRALNPGHLRWATAPKPPYELLVPAGSGSAFETALSTLSEADRVSWRYYKIQSGDSLIRIARLHNTQVRLLKEVNGIRGSRIRAGDTLLIPQGERWAQSLAQADTQPSEPQGYSVRRGDSLSRIAGKFKVSIKDIVAWNALDPKKYLQPGQRLTLYPAGG